jgi:ABC-type antimicrobial peptide transport system permease subunit
MAGYTVARRTREYAVRVACGARPEQVIRSIAGSVGGFAAIGLGIGFGAALASSRLLTGILYGVSPGDPRVHIVVVLILATVVAGAAIPPTRRVLAIDPARVLRED